MSLEVTISWNAPTQFTDGTPIQAGDIDHYTLEYSINGVQQPAVGVPGLSYSRAILQGQSVAATVKAVGKNGAISAASPASTEVINVTLQTPAAPTAPSIVGSEV